MFERIRQFVKLHEEEIIYGAAGFLAVTTISLGAYSIKTRAKYFAEYDRMQNMLDSIDAGYTPVIDWESKVVTFVMNE